MHSLSKTPYITKRKKQEKKPFDNIHNKQNKNINKKTNKTKKY